MKKDRKEPVAVAKMKERARSSTPISFPPKPILKSSTKSSGDVQKKKSV